MTFVAAYSIVFFRVNLPPGIHISLWALLLALALALNVRCGIRLHRSGLAKIEIVVADSYLVFLGAIGLLFLAVGSLTVLSR